MNGYFSRLIQQTGLSVGDQGKVKINEFRRTENKVADLHDRPEQPEPLEIEEVIEISAPSGSVTTDHHEISISSDERNSNIRVNEAEAVKRESLKPIKTSDQSDTLTSTESITSKINKFSGHVSFPHATAVRSENNSRASKPVRTKEKHQSQENYSESYISEQSEKETSPVTERTEIVTALENKPTPSEEDKHSKLQSEIEHSAISETADALSPASIEQHVYISQLPNSYQQAIKQWLISPVDGSKDKLSGRDNLRKTIKRKQNSEVILKPEQSKTDSFPNIQAGNEQFKPRDLHLSVGNINLTIEEPASSKQQPSPTISKPVRREQSGSSRLSRQYVRVR